MKNKQSNEKQNFFSLDDGNQDVLILYSTASQEWIDSIKSKFSWNDYDPYDNRMCEYMYKFFDDVVANSGVKAYDELWNKLNRSQKVFWAFLIFNGDTDNGGVYQFIFNRPKFIFAVAEMWDEIGMEKVTKDYEKVLGELAGKAGKISELKTAFNNDSLSWEDRFGSFSEGYEELKTTKIIEDYYYDDTFKKECHKKIAEYVEQNMNKFRK